MSPMLEWLVMFGVAVLDIWLVLELVGLVIHIKSEEDKDEEAK